MKTKKNIAISAVLKLAALALLASLGLSACNTGVVAGKAHEQPVRLAMRSNEAAVVNTAVSLFASDVKAVSDMDTEIVYDNFSSLDGKIFVATVGNSATLDEMEKMGEISLYPIRGKSQSFIVRSARLMNGEHVLFVVGSDANGTAYGVMELSKIMGVSPLERVKGEKPEHRQVIDFRGISVVGIPPAKIRKFFMKNDPKAGFESWAKSLQEGANPEEKLFELMLRTGGNTLVAGQHAFDKKLASKYGVNVLTEKTEPKTLSSTAKAPAPIDEGKIITVINACDYSNSYGKIERLKGFGRCGMAIRMEKGVQKIFRFANVEGKESAIFHFSFMHADGLDNGKARFAVSLDDGRIHTLEVDMAKDFHDDAAAAYAVLELPFKSKGMHKLTLISLTDGLILDQITVMEK